MCIWCDQWSVGGQGDWQELTVGLQEMAGTGVCLTWNCEAQSRPYRQDVGVRSETRLSSSRSRRDGSKGGWKTSKEEGALKFGRDGGGRAAKESGMLYNSNVVTVALQELRTQVWRKSGGVYREMRRCRKAIARCSGRRAEVWWVGGMPRTDECQRARPVATSSTICNEPIGIARGM